MLRVAGRQGGTGRAPRIWRLCRRRLLAGRQCTAAKPSLTHRCGQTPDPSGLQQPRAAAIVKQGQNQMKQASVGAGIEAQARALSLPLPPCLLFLVPRSGGPICATHNDNLSPGKPSSAAQLQGPQRAPATLLCPAVGVEARPRSLQPPHPSRDAASRSAAPGARPPEATRRCSGCMAIMSSGGR
jgi:hypothetical protein